IWTCGMISRHGRNPTRPIKHGRSLSLTSQRPSMIIGMI
ncbi:MAG: hypothetical protein ACI8RD_007368, partial [Bacillariaceae sp.]